MLQCCRTFRVPERLNSFCLTCETCLYFNVNCLHNNSKPIYGPLSLFIRDPQYTIIYYVNLSINENIIYIYIYNTLIDKMSYSKNKHTYTEMHLQYFKAV